MSVHSDITRQVVETIIRQAVYAPSGDNSQPWHFEIRGNDILVYNYPERDLPFYNYKQCGSHVAHGALLENISIAASTCELAAKINLFPRGVEDELVAIVTLSSQPGISPDLLAPFISKRVTNRRIYNKEAILPDVKAGIVAANQEEGVNVKFIDDPLKIKSISEASVVNEMTVLTTKAIHSFFFRHVVWSKEEEEKKRSGLFVKTLEMPRPQEIAFRLARFWPIMRAANFFGIYKKIAADNASLFQASASLVAFLSAGTEPKHFVAAGRAMQRVWLACSRVGIAAHPITGVLFLYQRVRAGTADGISSLQQQRIKTAYEVIVRETGVKDKSVIFLLRVGFAPAPTATSSRTNPVIVIK